MGVFRSQTPRALREGISPINARIMPAKTAAMIVKSDSALSFVIAKNDGIYDREICNHAIKK